MFGEAGAAILSGWDAQDERCRSGVEELFFARTDKAGTSNAAMPSPASASAFLGRAGSANRNKIVRHPDMPRASLLAAVGDAEFGPASVGAMCESLGLRRPAPLFRCRCPARCRAVIWSVCAWKPTSRSLPRGPGRIRRAQPPREAAAERLTLRRAPRRCWRGFAEPAFPTTPTSWRRRWRREPGGARRAAGARRMRRQAVPRACRSGRRRAGAFAGDRPASIAATSMSSLMNFRSGCPGRTRGRGAQRRLQQLQPDPRRGAAERRSLPGGGSDARRRHAGLFPASRRPLLNGETAWRDLPQRSRRVGGRLRGFSPSRGRPRAAFSGRAAQGPAGELIASARIFQQRCAEMNRLTAALEVTRIMGKAVRPSRAFCDGPLAQLLDDPDKFQQDIGIGLRDDRSRDRRHAPRRSA